MLISIFFSFLLKSCDAALIGLNKILKKFYEKKSPISFSQSVGSVLIAILLKGNYCEGSLPVMKNNYSLCHIQLHLLFNQLTVQVNVL